jgi:hypothetical protein
VPKLFNNSEKHLYKIKAQNNVTDVLFPIAIVICAVFILLGLGIYQRLNVDTEIRLNNEKDE